jgi:hypothetical protein
VRSQPASTAAPLKACNLDRDAPLLNLFVTLPRIAYVWIFIEGPSAPYADAFRERLRELGWIDGKTVVIETHDANRSDSQSRKLCCYARTK